MARRTNNAERADARSEAAIVANGWEIIRRRADGEGLFVARRAQREEGLTT